MADRLIITRHPAAAEFVRSQPGWGNAPVVSSATAEDVRGKIVAGNLPLNLAAEALEVWAVEFTGAPPRGQEYTLADMIRAGARLRPYRVEVLECCCQSCWCTDPADVRDPDDGRMYCRSCMEYVTTPAGDVLCGKHSDTRTVRGVIMWYPEAPPEDPGGEWAVRANSCLVGRYGNRFDAEKAAARFNVEAAEARLASRAYIERD